MKKIVLVLWLLGLWAGIASAAVYSIQGTNSNEEFGLRTIVSGATTGAGGGDTYVLPRIMSRFTWVTSYTGTPTGVSVTIEGSHNGTTWFTLDTSTTITGEMRHIIYKSVRYIRGNTGTLSGGTAPTATLYILGAKN